MRGYCGFQSLFDVPELVTFCSRNSVRFSGRLSSGFGGHIIYDTSCVFDKRYCKERLAQQLAMLSKKSSRV
jgi:hypothetical protein